MLSSSGDSGRVAYRLNILFGNGLAAPGKVTVEYVLGGERRAKTVRANDRTMLRPCQPSSGRGQGGPAAWMEPSAAAAAAAAGVGPSGGEGGKKKKKKKRKREEGAAAGAAADRKKEAKAKK